MGEDPGKEQKMAAPDGGYGWVVLLANLFTFMCFSGTFASYGIFLPELLETFRCTKAEVAVITALTGGASGVSGLFLGPLVQRFGSKRMALIGSCSLALGIIASSFAPSLYMLYVTYGILVGFYWACMQVSSTVIVVQYFDKRRGKAMGARAFGLSVGIFLIPYILRLLIDNYTWRGAMLIFGGFHLNTIVASLLFRPLKNPSTGGNKMTKMCTCKSIFNFQVMKYIKVDLYFMTNLLMLSGHAIVFLFTPGRLQSLGMSKDTGALMIMVIGIASSVGRPLTGVLADKTKKHRIFLHGLFIIMAGTVNIVTSQLVSFVPLLICSVLFGLFSGGYVALQFTVLGDITPMSHMAVATALLVATSGLSGLALYPLAGWFVDITGKYGTPFLIYGGLQIIGGIISCVIHVLHRRQRREKREALKTIDGTITYDDEADVGEEMVVIKGDENEVVSSEGEKLRLNDDPVQSEKLLTNENGVKKNVV